MELTEEVLQARAERIARRKAAVEAAIINARPENVKAREDARKARERKRLDEIKSKYPVQFAEFMRLKRLKVKYETTKYDDDLHWLQVEMMGGRNKWTWDPLQSDMQEYNSEELEIIWAVAGKYYEELENRLWAGEDIGHPIEDSTYSNELIRRIEDAGVDTFERAGDINLFAFEMECMPGDTRLRSLMLHWREHYNDSYCPEGLRF